MTLPAEFQRRTFTSAEVLRMAEVGILGEMEHVELIDGELIVTPPQGPEHTGLATRILRLLLAAYGDGYSVRAAAPLVLNDGSEPEPDLAVVRGAETLFLSRHPRGDEAALVIEVARTSLKLDREKASRYARAGVALYWIVNVNACCIEIYANPQRDGYSEASVARELVALPDTGIQWSVSEILISSMP